MVSYPKEIISNLIDGKLSWDRVKEIMSAPKDLDRFEKYIAILQERVPWKERILLPLTDHLYIVEKGDQRIVKCDCGYEFCDWRINWKLKALIYVRETEEELEELYPGMRKPDPRYCDIREYYCPGCGAQLEVECLPKGHPIIFDFLPDLDTFYRDWLNQPLAREEEFKDLTLEFIKNWYPEKDKGR